MKDKCSISIKQTLSINEISFLDISLNKFVIKYCDIEEIDS